MRGKSWSVEEERQLRELINKGVSISEIAQIMGKTRLAIRGKMNNLQLTVVVATTPQGTAATTATTTTSLVPHVEYVPAILSPDPVASSPVAIATSLKKDEPLPSIEEKLRVLNAALVALEQPGLSRNEITRLNKIIDGVKVYQVLFAKFVDYRGIEQRILELERKLADEKDKT